MGSHERTENMTGRTKEVVITENRKLPTKSFKKKKKNSKNHELAQI